MLTQDKNERYISIKADGKFHETVSKDTDGAILREYETSDGAKGEKWELVYSKLEGMITNIQFQEGDYGENMQITFRFEDESEVTLSQGVATNFGEDLMKKLPSIDFKDKVGLSPYSFEDERGKLIRGVGVYQTSDKVANFFWNGTDTLNGFPTPEGDTKNYDKDDWKIHFLKARKFLVSYTKENIVSKFAGAVETSGKVEYPENDIKPEDIPFD